MASRTPIGGMGCLSQTAPSSKRIDAINRMVTNVTTFCHFIGDENMANTFTRDVAIAVFGLIEKVRDVLDNMAKYGHPKSMDGDIKMTQIRTEAKAFLKQRWGVADPRVLITYPFVASPQGRTSTSSKS